jgi:hypothetical protein
MPKVEEKHIDHVLNILEIGEKEKSMLFQVVHDDFPGYWEHIIGEYKESFKPAEFDLLDFGMFIILASTISAGGTADIETFLEREEKNYLFIDDKSISSIEIFLEAKVDKVEQSDLVVFLLDYLYHDEQELPAITVNLIALVLLSVIESIVEKD